MNRTRVVCLIACILIVWIWAPNLETAAFTQPVAAAQDRVRGDETPTQTAPPLQAGISVQMPVTKNATPMPEADREDALIVTLTGAGKVYLGIQPSDLNLLQADLQRARASQKMSRTLYIKPDARVPYAMVMTVVDAAAAAGIERSVLLTSQPDSPQLQAPTPPRGFAIVTRGSCPERSRACL